MQYFHQKPKRLLKKALAFELTPNASPPKARPPHLKFTSPDKWKINLGRATSPITVGLVNYLNYDEIYTERILNLVRFLMRLLLKPSPNWGTLLPFILQQQVISNTGRTAAFYNGLKQKKGPYRPLTVITFLSIPNQG